MNTRQLRTTNREASQFSFAALKNAAESLGLDPNDFSADRINDVIAAARSGKSSPRQAKPKQQSTTPDTAAIVTSQNQALASVAHAGAAKGVQRADETVQRFEDALAGAFQGAQVQAYLKTVQTGVEEIADFVANPDAYDHSNLPESVQRLLQKMSIANADLNSLEAGLIVDIDAIDALEAGLVGGYLEGDEDDD
jgi:hypothetical protein